MTIRLKQCNKCYRFKSLCLFKKTPRRKMGVGPTCKYCHNKQYREWYHNGGNGIEASRRYRQNNPEKRKASVKKWDQSEAGVDHHRDMAHRRRLQMGPHRRAVKYSVVFQNDLGVCHICKVEVDRDIVFPDPMAGTIDHVIPLARGGEHTYENCRLAHKVCNERKGYK